MLDECIRDDKRWFVFSNGLTGKILVEHFLSRHRIALQGREVDEMRHEDRR